MQCPRTLSSVLPLLWVGFQGGCARLPWQHGTADRWLGGHKQPWIHHTRIDLVDKLIAKHDVVGLQEVRGPPSDIALWATRLQGQLVFDSHAVDSKGEELLVL